MAYSRADPHKRRESRLTARRKDPRTRDWFLTGSPWTLFAVLGTYLFVVKVAGPRFMKDRPAYNIDGIIAVYNIAQVIMCSYIFIRGFTFGWGTKLRFYCEPVDTSSKPLAFEMARFCWMVYLMKIFDLFDTVLYILRKKNNQVTFFHVIHHALALVVGYYLVRFTPGGNCVLDASVNCFVHVIMYSYYFISNIYNKNIWWKKHVTQIQMVQFVYYILHNLPAVLQKDCGFPAFAGAVICSGSVFMFYLFSKFYMKTYWKTKDN
ncbi:very long chain fatty acid elongase 7-like isoform X2 [Periplaneta americana]|uniref:very long chain fatty acid elongase 7-like isoform X2 n=1 Tax=Periplaneta americana TaxID=6978 RepID=UPI0037E9A1B5